MSQFMLLLRHPAITAAELSPPVFEELVVKVRAWHEKLEARATVVARGKLKNGEGKTLRQHGGRPLVFDGPYCETKEVLGGYFIIEAADYEAAVALAEGCPILSFEGSVEVRALDLAAADVPPVQDPAVAG